MSPGQQLVRDATVSGNAYVGSGLSEALHKVEYPLFFLDFETFSEPIPRYAGVRPWQVITFQWSCHELAEDGASAHHEFLHARDTDPRPELVESMLACLGEQGTILHYSPFEKTRLRELAVALPGFAGRLKQLEGRLCDLCQIMKSHYYHPEFIGSYSIKRVLPVLAPDLSYNEMDIQEGLTASVEYLRMLDPLTSPEDKSAVAQSLLAYCRLDTLAMVRIWEVLNQAAGKL